MENVGLENYKKIGNEGGFYFNKKRDKQFNIVTNSHKSSI